MPGMTTYVGLLRAVNLAGRNTVGMADLRRLLEKLAMRDVSTVLQSGNVVFRAEAQPAATLERTIEETAKKRLGLATDFFVRTAAEWQSITAANPFRAEAKRDPSHLVLVVLRDAPDRTAVTALQRAITGREVVRVAGRQAYVVYPDGIGRSRLTNALLESKLGTRGTGRNWNTVLKLGALAGGHERA